MIIGIDLVPMHILRHYKKKLAKIQITQTLNLLSFSSFKFIHFFHFNSSYNVPSHSIHSQIRRRSIRFNNSFINSNGRKNQLDKILTFRD